MRLSLTRRLALTRVLPAALLGVAGAACDSSTGPGAPASVAVLSGSGQRGVVGQAVANPVVVRVADDDGQPVRGATVHWTVTGGGSVTPASATTDGAGLAQAQWTLGGAVGQQTATATVEGVAQAATFTATAQMAATGATLAKVSGDAQAGPAGADLPQPLVVELRQNGVPLAGVQVAWTASGDGAVSATSTTDAQGRASTVWRLARAAGAQTVTAQAPGGVAPVTFTATAQAGAARYLEALATGAFPQTPRGGTDTVYARVLDLHGNPLGGVTVQWAVLVGGGTITASSVSGADGVAEAQWTLGGSGTGQVARGTAPGTNPVVYNRFPPQTPAGAPAQLQKVSGDGQSAYAGAPAADSLVVRVTDAQGRPVPNVGVGWVGANGPPGAVSATDSAGFARAQAFGADAAPGARTVTARVTGAGEVQFTLTTIAPPAGQVVAWMDTVRLTSLSAVSVVGATVYNADGTIRSRGTDRTATVWTLLDNTGAVQISGSGNLGRWLQAAAPGTERLQISAGGASDTVVVIVQQAPQLSQTPTAGLRVGQSSTVRVVDASGFPVAGTVWSSSDPSVATVSNGTYTGVAPGVAIIRAQMPNGEVWQFGVFVFVP
jgi:hypothetical protein